MKEEGLREMVIFVVKELNGRSLENCLSELRERECVCVKGERESELREKHERVKCVLNTQIHSVKQQ